MPTFAIQQDHDKCAQNLDVLGASNDPTTIPLVQDITELEVRNKINEALPDYTPPIDASYRQWELVDAKLVYSSPVELFLRFFRCILDLLLIHTNIAGQRASTAQNPWHRVTELELRRWVACRLEISKKVPANCDMQEFWANNHIANQYMGYQRFRIIEAHINMCSNGEKPTATSPWFWKVQLGMDQLREQCNQTLIPSSHICIDESSIKFFSRKKDKYKLLHKLAKEGFIYYALTSSGGLVHDFCMSSSQNRLEGIGEGYHIDLITRNLLEALSLLNWLSEAIQCI